MPNLNRIWVGALGALGVLAATGAVVVYTGRVEVAADTPHGPLLHRLLETARERAIARRVDGIIPSAGLDDPERQRRGAGNYAAMCADCHLAPGVENSEIRQGLYPAPPDLARPGPAADTSAARRFWIIKHGIKASGMPAWSKGGMEDGAIWDLVAFLGALPALSSAQYRDLVAASDGHSHAGAPRAKPAPSDTGHSHAEHAH